MVSRRFGWRVGGFTLIEMIVIVALVSILALIVIPRLLGASRKASETTLRGQLHQLRSALEQFRVDCGDYPAALADLQSKPEAGSTGGSGVSLEVDSWKGPYLHTASNGLPEDPFTGHGDWTYDAETGQVHSAAEGTGRDRSAYRTW